MIIELKDQVCDLKYAKEFRKLGVPQDSYWYWLKNCNDIWMIVSTYDLSQWDGSLIKEQYSTPTVAELGEMLPEYITHGIYGCSRFIQTKNIKQTVIRYIEFLKGDEEDCSEWETIIKITDNTEANARAKMLIWLIKNGYVNVKDLK